MTALRQIGKGQPITELIRGSPEMALDLIQAAFRDKFGEKIYDPGAGAYLHVVATFADFLLVRSSKDAPGPYWYVEYSLDGDTVTFAPRDEWEQVELTWKPTLAGGPGRQKETKSNGGQTGRGKGTRLVEQIDAAAMLLEAVDDQPRTIKAAVAKAGVVNLNGRRYRQDVLSEAVKEPDRTYTKVCHKAAPSCLARPNIPQRKTNAPRCLETIVVWTDLTYEAQTGLVEAEGNMLEKEIGKNAVILMDSGVFPGVSLRGYGESHTLEEDGRQIEEIDFFRFTGIDLVLEPGFHEAAVQVIESNNQAAETINEARRGLTGDLEDTGPVLEKENGYPTFTGFSGLFGPRPWPHYAANTTGT